MQSLTPLQVMTTLKLQTCHISQATDKTMQQRVAVALAWLGKEADLWQSFVDRRGLDVLLELLTDQRRDASSHKEAAGELYNILVIALPSCHSFLSSLCLSLVICYCCRQKRKDKTAPFGIHLVRSQVLHRAAQVLLRLPRL